MGTTEKLRGGLLRKALAAGMVAATLTMGLTGIVASSASASSSAKTTVIFAEQAQAPPNYIFPFMSLAFFSVYNISQFQYLMYRPLYWFGKTNTPDLNTSLSLAKKPVYSKTNTVVTITLKSYKWSNGETLTAKDVMFWMNMLHSEKTNWAAYAPGGSNIPDNVKSITIDSPTKLTFTLTQGFNTYWYTYNQLSQITPLPLAWTKTTTSGAPGSGGCATAPFGEADGPCAAVYTYLSKQAGYDPTNPKAANNSLATYATNPLWQVVDGPWHLTQFNVTGALTMAPNPSVLGPGEADDQEVRGGPVHLGHLGVQRPGRPEGDIRLPAAAGRHRPDQHTQGAGQEQPPPPVELQPGPAERVGDQLLPLQLQLDR